MLVQQKERRLDLALVHGERAAGHELATGAVVGKLVRKAAQDVLGLEPDRGQRFFHFVARFTPGLGQPELFDRNRQQVVYGIERVEDGERVLEDGLYFAPEGHAIVAAQAANILALVEDLP